VPFLIQSQSEHVPELEDDFDQEVEDFMRKLDGNKTARNKLSVNISNEWVKDLKQKLRK
jgi:hypothetical protein